MIHKLLTVFLVLAMMPIGISQVETTKFSHVIVPEQYDFLQGKDTYQLNSLTKFLLNKNGFKAVFENELSTINRCEVLWSDLEVDNGIIYTKATVILKDCNGAEVARSSEGKSKRKDYKKAYQEAIRNAFDGFNASTIELISAEVDIVNLPKKVQTETSKKLDSNETKPQIDVVTQPVISTKIEAPSTSLKTFSYEAYTIVSTVAGLQMNFNGAVIGKLLPTSNPEIFLVKSDMFYGVASKTNSGFLVEREVEGLNTLISMKFE